MAAACDRIRELVEKYRFDFFDTVTEEQRIKLRRLEKDLSDAADKFTAQAIETLLEGAKDAADGLTQATVKMRDTLKSEQNLTRVLNIASVAVKLFGAVASANPAAFSQALAEAFEVVKPPLKG